MTNLGITIAATFLVLTLTVGAAFSEELAAEEILKRADDVSNASEDVHSFMRTILIDSKGNQKERKSEMFQKGDKKRLVRFLSPADQKGIGFLSLPDDVQYVYLPAFHKVRRIASHVKNAKFAGTDFTYDDISQIRHADDYDPKLIEAADAHYVLELMPKPDVKKDYSKLRMWVRKDNFYPEKIEYYDRKGNLWKVSERRKIEQIDNYWMSKVVEMKDLKENHATQMIIDEIEFDIGLEDKLFTPRYLRRTK